MRMMLIVALIVACVALAGCGGSTGFGSGQSSNATGIGGFGNPTNQPARAATSALASSFWEIEKLRAEPKVEMGAETIEHSSTGDVACREIFYDSPGPNGKPLRIFAYYAFLASKKGTKLPGIVWVHGGASISSKQAVVEWASRGYAAISMDLPGKGGPYREKSRSEGPDMTDENTFKISPSPRDSFLYSAVNSVVRAVSVLSACKEVDPTRIGVIGYSWGGVITLVANGIDNRIGAACTVYGAGYMPEDSYWQTNGPLKTMSKKAIKTWQEHFDPSSYLASQSGKTLFAGATQDSYYPLRSFLKTYENAKCVKALCLVPNKNHDLDDAGREDVVKWFDWALRSGPSLPTLKVAQAAGKLKVTAGGARPVTAVSLLSADGTDFLKASWKADALVGKEGVWNGNAPKATVPYFITARDDGGALIAAEVHLPEIKADVTAKPVKPL